MKLKKGTSSLLVLCVASFTIFATAQFSFAQVNLRQLQMYTQHFDDLSSGTFLNNNSLSGWYLQHDLMPGSSFPIQANDGSNNSVGFYSFGSSSSVDRTLGGMTTNVTSGSGYIGLRIKNETGLVIRNFDISYAFEQWYNSRNEAAFEFSYATKPIGTAITSLQNGSASWQDINVLDVVSPSTLSSNGRKDGNAGDNRIVKSYTIIEVSLQPGQEIMFRWENVTNNSTNGNGLALDDVSITPQINEFYVGDSGSLGAPSTWSRSPNGHKSGHVDFSLPDQVFYITKGSSWKIKDDFYLSGNNSKIVLGDGETPVRLIVESAENPFLGNIDVADNATLIIENDIAPALGTLANTSTVHYSGSSNQSLTAPVYGNLQLSGTGKKVLAQNTLINGDLTLNQSDLVLGEYNVTIDKSRSINGGSSDGYIVTNGRGQLCLTVQNNNTGVLFPVGNSTYNPVSMAQGATGEEDVFKVRVLDNLSFDYEYDEPQWERFTSGAVNKTWLIEEGNVGGSDLNLNFFWDSLSALPDFYPGLAYISHYENGAWDEVATDTVDMIDNMYMLGRSGIASFSPFGVFSSSDNLPLELMDFTANRSERGVVLAWETSLGSARDFALEYSDDAQVFNTLAETSVVKNDNQKISHKYIDKREIKGKVYYRLAYTGSNGKKGYSSIISIAGTSLKNSVAFPNPTQGLVNIVVVMNDGEEVLITICDLWGKVYPIDIAEIAFSQFTLDLSLLAKSLYIIKVQTSSDTQLFRITKI